MSTAVTLTPAAIIEMTNAVIAKLEPKKIVCFSFIFPKAPSIGYFYAFSALLAFFFTNFN